MSWFGFGGNQSKNSAASGSSGNNNNPTYVEGILDRIPTITDIDDKKELINKLSSIGRNCHQIVGSKMKILTNSLKDNKDDIELVRETIEILTLIMTTTQKDDNIVEVHNTELFISDNENFNLICDLLLVNDYYVRYYISRFLNIIIKNRFETVQEAILKCPISMTNIMSLLMDSREMIRNESILIISELTKSNQEIQKIVAFGNGFEILLDIIDKEGHSDGGVVVLDSLQVLINLLKGNVLNQNYFRETGCIARLAPLLQVHNKDMWILSDQKFNIIMTCLELLLSLVERNNLSTIQNQLVLSKSGIMNLIIRLALGKMSSIIIKSKSLYILGEILYMNNDNINEFSSVSIKSEVTKQSQSALFRLTMVMLYNKDLLEKSSAFHTFKCYLLNNEEEQMALASTILQNQQTSTTNTANTPSTGTKGNSPLTTQQQQQEELENYSIGQHLIKSLFSFEQPLPGKLFEMSGFWYSSLVLIYMFKDSIHTKEQVLKMPLEIPKQASQVPVTLFTKLMNTLLSSKTKEMDQMIKIALLKVLATWLNQSPKTIKQFFDSQLNLSFIVENILQPVGVGSGSSSGSTSLSPHIQGLCTLILGICVQYMDDETSENNRANLNTIINHRIGLNAFKDKLDVIRKSDTFTSSEQGEIEFTTSAEKIQLHIYDFEFTLFFKDIYDKVRNIGVNVNKQRPGVRTTSNSNLNTSNTQSGISSPSGLQSLSPTSQPKHSHPPPQNATGSVTSPIQTPTIIQSQPNPINVELEKENSQLKQQNQELLNTINQLKLQLSQSEQLNHDNQRITDLLNDSNGKLQDFVAERDEIIEDLKEKNEYLQNKLSATANNNSNNSEGILGGNSDSSVDFFEVIKLRQDITDLQNQVSAQTNKINVLQSENQILGHQKEDLMKKLTTSPQPTSPSNSSNRPGGTSPNSIIELKLSRVEGELNELKVRYSALQKEQDDLYAYSVSLENQLNEK